MTDPTEPHNALPAASTDDPTREPDGVPHDIVGRTMFAAFLLSAVVLALFAVAGWVWALIVGLAAIPIMVVALSSSSARERDHDHPSR
jgi:hypothetical protein